MTPTTSLNTEALAIGHAVKAAISHAGLSQVEIADDAGIALTSLSRRLNGHIPFTFPELVRVCRVLDLNVGDLAERAERIAAELSS
ncbi:MULTISPECIES: helix-turn-helix domain-containing protein [unclassified Isoptericola]|uniref:helix-turn-helix domain-containing protein n=1 Tax=Isoptericola sp. NPDC057191 TaxID=3346041 RepID=UPI0036283AEF